MIKNHFVSIRMKSINKNEQPIGAVRIHNNYLHNGSEKTTFKRFEAHPLDVFRKSQTPEPYFLR